MQKVKTDFAAYSTLQLINTGFSFWTSGVQTQSNDRWQCVPTNAAQEPTRVRLGHGAHATDAVL